MKTKLNLICLVLLAVMVADLSGGRFEFNIGKNAANYENEMRQNGSSSLQQSEVIDARLLALLPISEKQTALTVTNKLTGKEVKVWPKTLYVEPDTYQSPSQWLFLVAVLAGLAAFICAIYAFVRFIIHVNHDRIFANGGVGTPRLRRYRLGVDVLRLSHQHTLLRHGGIRRRLALGRGIHTAAPGPHRLRGGTGVCHGSENERRTRPYHLTPWEK